jgi:uncharacterized membrane protein
MIRWIALWAACAAAMVLLDLVWLGLVARPLYAQGIGHLMAPAPRFGIALLFYAVYALGLTVFAVAPQDPPAGWRRTLCRAALFGVVAYATYDLSNLATLRDWPLGLSLLDIAWGAAASSLAAAVGRWVRVR